MATYDEWAVRYPNLQRAGFRISSPKDQTYNCLAWAAGKSDRLWQDDVGYEWPGKRCQNRIEGAVDVFTRLGYQTCGQNGKLERGYLKIVLYERNGFTQHAARQLPSGRWTSKIGWRNEDIEHATAECLVGPKQYGNIHCFMRRGDPDAAPVNPGFFRRAAVWLRLAR